MTVEELREALKDYDDELEVRLVSYEDYSELKGVFEVGGVVHLDGGFNE